MNLLKADTVHAEQSRNISSLNCLGSEQELLINEEDRIPYRTKKLQIFVNLPDIPQF